MKQAFPVALCLVLLYAEGFVAPVRLCALTQEPSAKPRALGIVPSLREVDEAVERVGLTEAMFEPMPEREKSTSQRAVPETDEQWEARLNAWNEQATPRADCVETIKHLRLFQEPHKLTAAIETVTAVKNGFRVVASIERNANGRIFTTPREADAIEDWDRRRRQMDADYAERLEFFNRRWRDPLYDPARDRAREVEEFETSRERDLRPIHENVKARKELFTQIRLGLFLRSPLMEQVDPAKVARAKKMRCVVRFADALLCPPQSDVKLPAVVCFLAGEIVEVDRYFLRK